MTAVDFKIEALELFELYYERAAYGWEEKGLRETPYRLNMPAGWDGNDPWRTILANSYLVKSVIRGKFAFAIPNLEAIEAIAELSPVVELGAGTGYWAYCLQRAGAEVVAIDHEPGDGNEWVDPDTRWVEVLEGTPAALDYYPTHTLLLCWPPWGGRMATDCLYSYAGDTVVYIGEWNGCTADDEFHTLLVDEWDEVAEITIPQFPGMHDYVSIHKRKG